MTGSHKNMSTKMNLADRMKRYESIYHEIYLQPRTPVIIRVDGKAFHTLTRSCKRPFDEDFGRAMDYTATALLNEVQCSRFAYIQSDEISLLLIDYNKFDSCQWFDGNLQKIISVSASIATAAFCEFWTEDGFKKKVFFDSRAFSLSEREVVNYFIWRQQDATRNSIQMVAQALYSHKQLLNKNADEQQEMIFQKGQNWNDLSPYWKRGRVAIKDKVDKKIPIFSKKRKYIEKFMKIDEE